MTLNFNLNSFNNKQKYKIGDKWNFGRILTTEFV